MKRAIFGIGTVFAVLSVILVISVIIVVAMAADWPQFQRDEINIGKTSDCGPMNGPQLWWWHHIGRIDTVPVVVGDYVYVVANSKLFKFNKNTGEVIWYTTIDSTPNFQLSTPAYGNGKIFVANTHGRLYAINATSGYECWDVFVCDGQLNTPITYYKAPGGYGRVFFGTYK